METKTIGAVLLAGGQGARMGSPGGDKTLLPLLGKPVIQYSLEALAASTRIGHLVVVTRDAAAQEAMRHLIPGGLDVSWALGGQRRQDSVLAGLEALPNRIETVLVQDGARPLLTVQAVQAVLSALREYDAAALASPVTDTVVLAQEGDPIMASALPRSQLWAMQTPQGARRKLLESALRSLQSETVTDEANALHRAGHAVFLVHYLSPNPKLTYSSDGVLLEELLKAHNTLLTQGL